MTDMNLNQIERGDTVRVVFAYPEMHTPHFEGIVLYVPCDTGDCWHIRERGDDGRLRYVQTFADITLIKKNDVQPSDRHEHG